MRRGSAEGMHVLPRQAVGRASAARTGRIIEGERVCVDRRQREPRASEEVAGVPNCGGQGEKAIDERG